MQNHTVAAHTWTREIEDDKASTSPESVLLFSLLGFVASAAVLLTSSAQTVAAITAALM